MRERIKPGRHGKMLPVVLKVVIFLFLIILLSVGSDWMVVLLKPLFADWKQSWGQWALILALPVYIILMSIPFVPGLEIGLALLMVFGADVAVFVYLCTLMALSLSFFAGRSVPLNSLISFMQFLHLQQAAAFMIELQGVERKHLIDVLTSQVPNRIIPFLIRHRFIALIVLLNLPGNSFIGGGGGIGLIAGLSRLFSYRQFLFIIGLAVAPVPVFFYLGIPG